LDNSYGMSLSEEIFCIPLVVITIQSFPRSLVTEIVKKVTRRVRHVEEELLSLARVQSPLLVGFRVARFLVLFIVL